MLVQLILADHFDSSLINSVGAAGMIFGSHYGLPTMLQNMLEDAIVVGGNHHLITAFRLLHLYIHPHHHRHTIDHGQWLSRKAG